MSSAPLTPVGALERACQVGKKAGLDFVYLGNVPGHRLENTHCPECGALLIQRRGFEVSACHLDRGCCPQCGREVPGVWDRMGQIRDKGTAGWQIPGIRQGFWNQVWLRYRKEAKS